MLDFYAMISNIRKWDNKQVENIVNKEIIELDNSLNKYVDSYEELCKVCCSNLYDSLNKYDLNVKKVNIGDIYKEVKDHVFILLSYQDLENKVKYILIDPTYSQFLKKDNQVSPLYFEAWPSEILQNINPILLKNLLKDKYSYVNDDIIKDYLSSFTNKKTNINLETIIFDKYKSKQR